MMKFPLAHDWNDETDSPEVTACALALLTAWTHHTTNADWRDETGLDLDDSDAVCPTVAVLGGVVVASGDDEGSYVALRRMHPSGVEAIVIVNDPDGHVDADVRRVNANGADV